MELRVNNYYTRLHFKNTHVIVRIRCRRFYCYVLHRPRGSKLRVNTDISRYPPITPVESPIVKKTLRSIQKTKTHSRRSCIPEFDVTGASNGRRWKLEGRCSQFDGWEEPRYSAGVVSLSGRDAGFDAVEPRLAERLSDGPWRAKLPRERGGGRGVNAGVRARAVHVGGRPTEAQVRVVQCRAVRETAPLWRGSWREHSARAEVVCRRRLFRMVDRR